MSDDQLQLTQHHQPVDSYTRLQAAGADNVLVISTTLAGLTLRSIYVGAGVNATPTSRIWRCAAPHLPS